MDKLAKGTLNMIDAEKINNENSTPKTRRGVVLYETNPFIATTATNTKHGVKRITNRTGDKMLVVSENTGEVFGGAGFWQAQDVDKTQFVKLYVNGVKAFKDLTGAGTKVFEVFYLEVQKQIGKDRVYLSYSALNHEITPMSSATYDRGMRELLEKKFLAPTMIQGWFYINPDYVWNGDRLAFVKEYRVKGALPKNDAMKLEEAGQQRLIE